MRQAFTGQQGQGLNNPYQNNQGAFGDGVEGDRLGNLKRAIGAIEQRMASFQQLPSSGYSHVPPYAQVQPAQGAYPINNGNELGMLQEQLNQLSNQIAMPQNLAPQNHMPAPTLQATGAQAIGGMESDMKNIASQIAQRQKVLNNTVASQTASLTQPINSTPVADKAGMELIGKHLDGLKKELSQLKQQVAKPVSIQQTVSQKEIDRIAGAIAELQKGTQFDEAAFERLGKELEEMRNGMKQDMRQAVRTEIATTNSNQSNALSSRFDTSLDILKKELSTATKKSSGDLGTKIDALYKSLDEISLQSANTVVPRMDNLANQMDELRLTVDDLPQTLAISRLEEHLANVISKIENITGTNGESGVVSQDIQSIESRLDEIARALVAVSNSNTAAPAPIVDMSAVDRIEARMSELARVIDEVAEKDNSSDLQNIAVRIDGLTERLGSFEKYAKSGDLGGASAMFAAPDIGVIEDQLRQLNVRVEEAAQNTQTTQMEEQLSQLSLRVEEAANVNSTAAQMSGLEAQIGQIIRQMNKPGEGGAIDMAPLESRLGQIEAQLVSNQNFSLEAAQQAAQQAVSLMGEHSEPGQIITALSQDLKSLQTAAEAGNAHNAQTVESVQLTLEQVVERLASIEGSIVNAAATRPAQLLNEQTTDLTSQVNVPQSAQLEAAGIDQEQLGVIQQAAHDAGFVSNPDTTDRPHNAPEGANSAMVDAPSIDPTDYIEQSQASAPEDNSLLEPGSAVPDLDQMVVSASAKLDETKASIAGKESLDNARPGDDMRPDAVAAARRALQATTAEMNAVKDEAESSKKFTGKGLAAKIGGGKSSFDLSKLRKPLVMGAAALLLAIVAFKGAAMFTGSSETPVAKIDNSTIEMSVKDANETPEAKSENGEASMDAQAGNVEVTTSEPRLIDDGASVDPVTEQADEKINTDIAGSTEGTILQASGNESAENTLDSEGERVTEAAEQNKDEALETKMATAEEPAAAEEVTVKPKFEVSSGAGSAALVAAASSGDPKALFQIGMRYSDGNDVKRNMTESAKWFEIAANKGFAPAQYSIGSLYEKGIGVTRDVQMASQWYEKAAQQGNARAMHNLAVIYAMGNPPEVQPNMDTAVGWFKKAAEFGIKDSQFNLGILYGQGMGVPQNLGDSYKWFALAAKTGDTDASSKRDEVANAMEPTDLDAARKVVNNWTPQKLTESANRVAVPKEWQGKGSAGKNASLNSSQQTVKQAQASLNQRGFNVGSPDGLIGPKTKQAIMEFQRSAGIPITGKVDKKLLRALDVKT